MTASLSIAHWTLKCPLGQCCCASSCRAFLHKPCWRHQGTRLHRSLSFSRLNRLVGNSLGLTCFMWTCLCIIWARGSNTGFEDSSAAATLIACKRLEGLFIYSLLLLRRDSDNCHLEPADNTVPCLGGGYPSLSPFMIQFMAS